MQRLLPWLLVVGIAVSFAAHLVLHHGGTPDGGQAPDEHSDANGSSSNESRSVNQPVYEPPSAELLRLRGEVARLREETNRLAEEWQSSTSTLRSFRTELSRLHREHEKMIRELSVLRDMTNTTPRPPRVGAWLGIGVVDAKRPDSSPGTPQGVEVGNLSRNAPSHPDLQAGDIITAIDGIPVPDVTTFKAIMATNHAGATFKFTLLRKGAIEVVEVGSGAWPQ